MQGIKPRRIIKMRILSGLLISIFFYSVSLAQPDVSLWHTQKSEHFIVYFQDAPAGYIEKLISKAEDYYRSITEELGFTRFEGFWTWDKRAKIYLFANMREYQKSTDQPEWSGGKVNVVSREIVTYVDMQEFFDIILPHELGHIVFREFIGYKRRLPLWLDEGVVSFLEKSYKKERLEAASFLVRTKAFIPLEKLEEMRSGDIKTPGIFYAESASIIEFLVRTYGKDMFVDFCRKLKQLREDQSWEVALRDVYRFKNFSEMNDAWVKFLYTGE